MSKPTPTTQFCWVCGREHAPTRAKQHLCRRCVAQRKRRRSGRVRRALRLIRSEAAR